MLSKWKTNEEEKNCVTFILKKNKEIKKKF